MEIRKRLVAWLCPDILKELDRLRWLSEANSDIHFLRLPFVPAVEEEAFQNARALEDDLVAQKITIQDRHKSLIQILKNKGLIKSKEK